MAYYNQGYNLGGYPNNAGTYNIQPPMPDNLANLRANPYQQQGYYPQNALQYMTQNQQTTSPAASNNNMNFYNGGRIWVSSFKEVEDHLLAPNMSVDLWDNSNPNVLYVKKSDASGKTETDIYDLIKRPKNEIQSSEMAFAPKNIRQYEFVPRSEFDALNAKFEDLNAKFMQMLTITNEKDITKSGKEKKESKE